MGSFISKSTTKQINETSVVYNKGIKKDETSVVYNIGFEKSELPCFYSLDSEEWYIKSNPDKYQTFKNFIKNEANLEWKLAECTVNDIREYHPESRIIFDCQNKIIISCPFLNTFITKNNLLLSRDFNFLKYEQGCFALKHLDRFGDYTCLIFPAGYQSTGGELII